MSEFGTDITRFNNKMEMGQGRCVANNLDDDDDELAEFANVISLVYIKKYLDFVFIKATSLFVHFPCMNP